MVPPRTRADPEDYYARLGLSPSASRADIVAAFRVKARLLHPDVPKTGNSVAFVAVKQAYDVLSNVERHAAYDRGASKAADNDVEPEVVIVRRPNRPVQPEPVMAGVLPRPGFFDLSA